MKRFIGALGLTAALAASASAQECAGADSIMLSVTAIDTLVVKEERADSAKGSIRVSEAPRCADDLLGDYEFALTRRPPAIKRGLANMLEPEAWQAYNDFTRALPSDSMFPLAMSTNAFRRALELSGNPSVNRYGWIKPSKPHYLTGRK